MADEGGPLLRLGAPRTFERRKRKMSFPPPPERQPAAHGLTLRRGVTEVLRHFSEGATRLPILATDVPYVRIELAPRAFVTDAELRSVGLEPVYRREDAILAAYSRDRDLRAFSEQVGSYEQLKKKLQVLAKIETVKPWSRADRTGPRLAEQALETDRVYTVDLLLMPWENEQPNPGAVRALQTFVEQARGRIVDRALEPTFAVLRVRVGGQALDQILDYRDDVALVELPPAARVVVPEVLGLRLDDLPEVEPPDATAPAICVVDSGILEGHPLLEPAIVGAMSRSFPPTLGSPVPSPPVTAAGHGTQVAGVALYGDVAGCAHAKAFSPKLRIINARMLDDDNALHPDRMPFLRDVVEHVKDECRVLNLSFGLDPHGGFMSVHAAELDALAREFSVLFVVSSGNVPATLVGKAVTKPYPNFMLEAQWNVLSPAEALNVLTVGGITPDSDPHPEKKSRSPVAPKRAPSPFSCAGGLKGVLKPELVEVAGNMAFDEDLKRLIDNDPGLRVVTTSPQFSSGNLVGFVHGTSFAAPKVAHMAATLLARYPDAGANLVRALLVQSAERPEGSETWDKPMAMRLCGFGVPKLDRAMYCRPQRVTLYYEGEIVPDEVKIFDVPVPQEFSKTKGRKAITVTVAYDPPVSVVHRDRPAGTRLTWGLARGDVPDAKLQTAITTEAAEEEPSVAPPSEPPADDPKRKAKSPFLGGQLPKRPQQHSTVQKNVFVWKRGQYGDTYRLALTARAVRPTHAELKQRFAVVVSLDCEADDVNVFNLVRARLGAGRVRVRVPAR